MKSKLINIIFAIILLTLIISTFYYFYSKKIIIIDVDESLLSIDIEDPPLSNYQFLDEYIKIYGLLKYFHPEYLNGLNNIDSTFICNLLPQDLLFSKLIFNKIIKDISIPSGKCKTYKNHVQKKNTDTLNNNLFLWIDNSEILDSINKSYLKSITHNINQRDRLHYVKNYEGNIGEALFINEELKNDTIYPCYNSRILSLAKLWNVLNYFYPYKSHIVLFNDINLKYLPLLIHSKNSTEYHLTVLRLTAELKDAHVIMRSSVLSDYFGRKYLPFLIEFASSHFYISSPFFEFNEVKAGDIILSLNNHSIDSLSKKYEELISSNNKFFIKNKVCSLLVKTKNDSVTVKIVRSKDTLQFITPTISHQEHYAIVRKYNTKNAVIKKYNTTYLNLRKANQKEIDNAFNYSDTIIFDLRYHIKNGIMYHIADKLLSKKQKFALFSMPDLNNPGKFQYTDDYYCGKNNENPFNGKLIVIINENTISQAESACMIFSLYKKTVFIGRRSCGANGDITYLKLPGKIRVKFSGIGVYHLNGNKLQNTGIKVDKFIVKQPNHIKHNIDEIFEYLNLYPN